MRSGVQNPFSADSLTFCREADAPRVVTEHVAVTGNIPYLKGLAPMQRPLLPGYDSGVVCLILGVFMVAALNIRHYSSFLTSLVHDLWQVRRRSNAFDDATVSEMRMTLSFVLLLCVGEGILLFSSSLGPGLSSWPFFHIIIFTGVAAACYIFQLTAYTVVGHVFTGRVEARQWVKGFVASQSLLGIGLTVPAIVVLFDPGLSAVMCGIGVLLYLLARMTFIFKGFRIFYTIPSSLVYFILYLCTLEIVPLLIIYHLSAIINALEPYK